MDKLLKLLDTNARLTNAQLAVMLDRPEAEVAAQIAALERSGVIRAYKALIDWDRTEREYVTAIIELKVTPKRDLGFEAVAETIMRFEEVESVYLMSGAFDLTVIISGRTLREVASFVSDRLAPLEGVTSTATHFILKKYKDHGTVLGQAKTDERMVITP